MSLADRIRTVLTEMDGPDYGKQARLAEIAKCGRPVVNHWLSQTQHKIGTKHALAICAAFGYRPEWLIAGKGPKRESAVEIEPESKPELGAKDARDADTGEALHMVHLTMKELEMLCTYRSAGVMDRILIERIFTIVEREPQA